MLTNTAVSFEFLSALFALIFVGKYKKSALLFFLFLLCYTAFNEIIGIWYADSNIAGNNYILFNIRDFLYLSFLFWMYQKNMISRNRQRLVQLFLVVYLLISIINATYSNFITDGQVLASITGGVFLIISIMLYFIELLYTKDIVKIKQDLLVYISLGNLIFYVGYIPIDVMIQLSFRSVRITDFDSFYFILNYIQAALVILMNLIFIIGFLWAEKRSN